MLSSATLKVPVFHTATCPAGTCKICHVSLSAAEKSSHLCVQQYHCSSCNISFHRDQRDAHLQGSTHLRNTKKPAWHVGSKTETSKISGYVFATKKLQQKKGQHNGFTTDDEMDLRCCDSDDDWSGRASPYY